MRSRRQNDRTNLFWMLQAGGWGAFGSAMLLAGISQFPLRFALLYKLTLTATGFALSLVLRFLYRALSARGVRQPALAASALPLSFCAAALWMAAEHLILRTDSALRRHAAGEALRGFPDFTNSIYFFFLLLAWSALYFGVPAYLDLTEERERLLRAELSAQRARLSALRLQLNPHFLANALNAVSTLVAEEKPAEANRMISRLAEFLSATLERADVDEVALSEEIDFARRYLEIEQIRFGDRLRVSFAVDPAAENALVPSMILQPIAENAVRHAILPRPGGGSVAIIASARDGRLSIDVDDDGPGLSASGESGRGIGLANTRARLAELYGGDAGVSLSESGLGGLSVSIRMPLRAAATAES